MPEAMTIESIYPLAPMQEGMWFHALYTPEDDVYVEQVTCLIEGPLDPAAFSRAWNEVVARHTALRTSFHAVDGKPPVQAVHRAVEVPWTREDWRDVPAQEQQERLEAFLRADRARGFDPARPPLVRFALLRLDDAAHQFVWTHHHLLLDGWSVPLVLQEVAACYAATRDGRPAALPAARPYQDYVSWLERQDKAVAEEFWRAGLKGFHEPTPLPLDLGPGDTQPEYATRRVELPQPVTADLLTMARQHGITPSTVVQAAWALLLSRYSGERDVLHGMTVAGRPADLPGVEEMVGLFINTVPVRIQVEPARPASEWLRGVQNRLLDLRGYEHTPLARVQGVAEVPSGVPLFESLVVFENYPVAPGEAQGAFAGLAVRQGETEERTSFPVTLVAVPGSVLGLQMIFDRHRLAPQDATTLLDQLTHLLTTLAHTPDTPVGALPLTTEQTSHDLATRWTATSTPYPRDRSLIDQFTEQATTRPHAIALTDGDRHYTYAHLATRANTTATTLHLPPGARVGIFLPRGRNLVHATLATLQAGAAYVPLDPAYPAERLSLMITDSRLHAILTDTHHHPDLPHTPHNPPVHLIDQTTTPSTTPSTTTNPTPPTTGDHPAYLMYTSGSTGTPKGILIPQHAVTRLVRNTDYIHLTPTDRIAFASNTAFDAATFELWGTLLNGATLVIVHPHDVLTPTTYAHTITQHAITTVFMTTALLHQIAATHPTALAPLRHLLAGGEKMDPHLLNTLLTQGPPEHFLHVYGPTESTTFALSHPIHHLTPHTTHVPNGHPIANTTAHLLDPNGHPVPPGATGELHLGGDGLAHGYWNQPALTAQHFTPDPYSTTPGARLYHTGDLMIADHTNTLTFLRRADHQIKLRGYRIEPGEIENTLRTHPHVHAAAVQLREDTPGDKRLAAYIVTTHPTPTPQQLRDHCTQHLPPYMVPTTYTHLDQLPLTPNGKTNYHALPTPDTTAGSPDASYQAPRSAVEAVLAGIWQDVLGVDRVGVDDDFFALGGHSLLAARVHNRLRAVFGVEVPLRLLFSEPTVAALASGVEAVRRAEAGVPVEAPPPIVPGSVGEPVPLSFSQRRLWFLERWEPGTSLYHITAALRLHGPLAVNAFRTGWQRLVDRHGALRTVLDDSDPDEPRQVVRPHDAVRVPLVDLSALPETDRAQAAARLVDEVTGRPFELTEGPLWRVALLCLGPTEHVLAIGLHHLIADGHSLEVLLAELGAQYQAAENGRELELPPLPVQFADYASWQRGWLTGDRLAAELGYWKEQLAGLPTTTLPTDRPREAARSSAAAIESVELSASADARLQAISREVGVTPFMTLLTAFAVALGQNRGLDEVVVGTPIVGRSRAEVEGLIGFFANTLALRLDLNGDPTFRELLGRAREVCLDAYAHQDVPFERVVQELRPERSDNHLPFFQTWFVVQEAPEVAQAFAGLGVEPVRHGEQLARYDLRLDVQRLGERLRAAFEYKTELFESASIARLARRFGQLLEVAAVEPDARLSVLTRQVGEADDRARRERRGSVSLASLKRLQGARREITKETGGSKPAEGGIA